MSGILQLVNNLVIKTKLSGQLVQFRTLQPICAALQVKNDRLALQLCNKALKRQPNDPLVLTLKALTVAISKSGSPTSVKEASEMVQLVQTLDQGKALGDPDMVTLLSWILSAIGKSSDTPALLSAAVKQHPHNEQLISEAFLQYIRSNDFRNAQQLGMKLHKDFPQQSQYLWWSVLATLLHVQNAPQDSSSRLLLSLAERQVSNHFAKQFEREAEEDKHTLVYDNQHEFHVVTRLLETRARIERDCNSKPTSNGTTEKASTSNILILPSLPKPSTFNESATMTAKQALLAHFASEEGQRWCRQSLELELRRRTIELEWGSHDDETWSKACDRLSKQLREGDTNWHTMLYLIRCAFAQADNAESETKSAGPTDKGAGLIDDARQLFSNLTQTSTKAKTERGFPLALLEIVKQQRLRKWFESDNIVQLVERYFDQFSTKMCCFDDLKPYLDVLSVEEINQVTRLVTSQSEKEGNVPLNQAMQAINAAKIERTTTPALNSEKEIEKANEFLERYFNALPLGKGLPPTELQPADDFAILAAQCLVAAYYKAHDRSLLERAIVILEYVLLRSKYRYQARILLINILRLLGASSSSVHHFKLLNLKSIQLDTLSHLVLSRSATFGVVNQSKDDNGLVGIATSSIRFHEIGTNEATEMIVRAFNLNTFSKVEDFVTFTDRLRHSLSHQLTSLEQLRLSIIRNTFNNDIDSFQQAESFLQAMSNNVNDNVSDNRDFKTLPDFQTSTSEGIWNMTSFGGHKIGVIWLRTFVTIYSNFLCNASYSVADESNSNVEITKAEADLLKFSQTAKTAFEAPVDDTQIHETVVTYFKDQSIELAAMLEDETRLPWEIVHVAQIAFEGYCLLEAGTDQTIARLASVKAPDHVKRTKQLKQLRTFARDEMRLIGAKVTTYGKRVAKERTKTLTNMSSLKQFQALNEDYLMNVAHTLVESRRAMAEGLGSAIHRRCAK
ncbi:mitochondrial distribution and morphology [Microbotryomycetes sp. JL221]|nr:mitochondrial distribution and morphology [Microbotryomycetes sp. JL221]